MKSCVLLWRVFSKLFWLGLLRNHSEHLSNRITTPWQVATIENTEQHCDDKVYKGKHINIVLWVNDGLMVIIGYAANAYAPLPLFVLFLSFFHTALGFFLSHAFLFQSQSSLPQNLEREVPCFHNQAMERTKFKALKRKIKEKGGRLEWQKCIIWINNNVKNVFYYT